MIPIQLSLKNFMSYADPPETLRFDGFHVVCLSGENGNGKSALLDAITWALWDRTRAASSSTSVDDLIRLGAEDMEVVFEFELNGQKYKVTKKRRRGKNSEWHLAVWDGKDWVSLSGATQRETEKKIAHLLSMDYETFLNSAYLQQGRADEFPRQSADKRKQILGQILGLERYDRLRELARGKAQELKTEIGDLEGQVRLLDGEIKNLPTYQQQLQEVQTELKKLLAEETDLEAQRVKLQKELARLSALEQQLQRFKQSLVNESAEREAQKQGYENALARLQAMEQLLSQSETIRKDYEEWQKARQRVQELEPRQKEYHEAELQKSQLLAELDIKKQELEHALEAKRQEAHRYDQEIKTKQELQQEIAALEQEIEKSKDVQAKWQALQTDATQLEQRLKEAEENLQLLNELVQDVTRMQEAVRNALSLKERDIAQYERDMQMKRQLLEQQKHLKEKLTSANQIQAQRDDAKRSLEAAQQQFQQLRAENESIKKNLEEIEDILLLLQPSGASCPVCSSPLSEERRKQLVLSHEAKQKALKDRLEQIRLQANELKKSIQDFKTQLQALENDWQQVLALKANLSAIEQQLAAYASLEQEHQQAKAQHDTWRALADQDHLPELVQALQVHAHAMQHSLPSQWLDGVRKQAELAGVDSIKQLHRLLQQRKDEKADLDTQRSKIQSDIQSLQNERDQHFRSKARRDALVEQLKGYLHSETKFAQAQKELDALKQKLEQQDYGHPERARLKIVEAELAKLQALVQELEKARKRAQELEPARQRFEDLARTQADIGSQRAECERLQKALEQKEQQIQNIQNEIDIANSQLQGAAATRQQSEQVESSLNGVKQQIAQHQREEGRLLQAAQSAECAREQKQCLEKQLKELREQKQLYDHLDVAFSRKGLQALIIENVLAELEEEANELLHRLSDGRMRLRFVTQRSAKTSRSKGNEIETLDIEITDDVGTRPYELFSGGEAFRISFALRIALSHLLARRSGTRLQTLILDEGFGSQDGKGRERIVEAIEAIKEDFEKIVVITHIDDLKDSFAHRVEVTKDEAGSHIHVL